MKKIISFFAATALIAAGCGGSDESAETTSPTTTTTTTVATTTTVPPNTTTTTIPSDASGECTSDEGFSVAFPERWVTPVEGAVGHCTRFDTEPFTVPEGTDARPNAISIYHEDVGFAVAAEPMGEEVSRAATAIDGRQAVRIERVADGEAFYSAGTRITSYLVDLSVGPDDGDGTLVANVVDFATEDYAAATAVLDQMVRDLAITAGDPVDDDIVARYEGGGTPFTVAATSDGAEVCLAVDPGAITGCEAAPGPASLTLVELDESADATVGLVGDRTARVRVLAGTDPTDYLPAPVDGADARAWAVPLTEIDHVAWFDASGTELGRTTLDETEPLADFKTPPVTTDDFPGSGTPAYLSDVRSAAHSGFERVVFEFDAAGVSYDIQYVEEAIPPSGDPVAIAGEEILQIAMTPASGVDLTGDTPVQTYEGPERFTPAGSDLILEIVGVEDFENYLVWAIGLDGTPEIAVATLEDPFRLVVDVATD